MKKDRGRKQQSIAPKQTHGGGRVVFGVGSVRALLAARPKSISLVYVVGKDRGEGGIVSKEARDVGIRVVVSDRATLAQLVPADANHQGVVAIAEAYPYVQLKDLLSTIDATQLWLALDSIQDPHNLGAIVRSAYLLGVSGIVLPRDRSCGVTPVVTKTSAGATEHVAIAQVTNLARCLGDMKKAGVWIAALAHSDGSQPIGQLDCDAPLCLVVGNEGSGIRPLVRKQCDYAVHIPMAKDQIDSLNVSVATSIACYEIARRRRSG